MLRQVWHVLDLLFIITSTVTSPSIICMTTVNPFVFHTVNVKLCSHIIVVQRETYATDEDLFQSALSSVILEQLKIMKRKNEELKIFYSILGQWKSEHLDLIRDDQKRKQFNQQVKQYLTENDLDGFDIDWNIPVDAIAALTSKHLLSTWLLELKNNFAPNELSLSIGVSGNQFILENTYDFDKISRTVDFIRLMAFDWPSKSVTSLMNPLFPVNNDQLNNMNWAIDYVTAFGISPEQISLGIPTYGQWFGLADNNQNAIVSSVIGSSIALAYSDICKLLKRNDYIKQYHKLNRPSDSYNQNKKQWISSDTINDVTLKARFAKLERLGGATLSSIRMDDVDERCGHDPYPLLHAVSNIFDINTENPSVQKKIENNSQNQLKEKYVFCSVGSKVEDYSDTIHFTLDEINTHLCTHLLIDNHSSLLSTSTSKRLKNANSNLKILLKFTANENGNLEQWKEEIEKKKADGLNILIDLNAFSDEITELIKSIAPALSHEQLFTISLQFPADPSQQASVLQVMELHKFVDYMIILPFDEKSINEFKQIQHWNTLATFVPANPQKNIEDFSMISMLLFILAAGVPKEKLIFSIPTYGLAFVLENEEKYQIGDDILGQGLLKRITNRAAMLASYEICQQIELNNYDRFLSNESVIVVARQKKNFITFDDTQPLQLNEKLILNGTVELKATFIKNAQLAGVLIHPLEMDDYAGLCKRGKSPITTLISQLFSTSIRSKKTTSTSTTSTSKTSNAKQHPYSGEEKAYSNEPSEFSKIVWQIRIYLVHGICAVAALLTIYLLFVWLASLLAPKIAIIRNRPNRAAQFMADLLVLNNHRD